MLGQTVDLLRTRLNGEHFDWSIASRKCGRQPFLGRKNFQQSQQSTDFVLPVPWKKVERVWCQVLRRWSQIVERCQLRHENFPVLTLSVLIRGSSFRRTNYRTVCPDIPTIRCALSSMVKTTCSLYNIEAEGNMIHDRKIFSMTFTAYLFHPCLFLGRKLIVPGITHYADDHN